MEANRQTPVVFLKGIDQVIRRDLGKHKELLAQTVAERDAFRAAVKHESARKRHYYRQIGKGKFSDDALLRSVKDIRINIRHLSDKVKLSEEKIDHHTMIVETLTVQLKEYDEAYAARNRQLQ